MTASPDIQDSTTIPHVTIIGGAPETEYDYYSFSVATAGTAGIFDIDYAIVDNGEGLSGFDSFLRLMDSSGNSLLTNDDSSTASGAGGSIHQYDSFLSYIFPTAGTYAIRVGRCCEGGSNGSYQLQVSLEAPGMTAAVPEPGTWAMMLIGFGGIGAAMRRRRTPKATPQLA